MLLGGSGIEAGGLLEPFPDEPQAAVEINRNAPNRKYLGAFDKRIRVPEF